MNITPTAAEARFKELCVLDEIIYVLSASNSHNYSIFRRTITCESLTLMSFVVNCLNVSEIRVNITEFSASPTLNSLKLIFFDQLTLTLQTATLV